MMQITCGMKTKFSTKEYDNLHPFSPALTISNSSRQECLRYQLTCNRIVRAIPVNHQKIWNKPKKLKKITNKTKE